MIQNNWLLFLIGQYPHGPLGGLASTLLISAASLLLSFPVGLLLALARVSPIRVIRAVAFFLVYFIRGIPILMLVFWAYFVVPLLTGHAVSGVTTLIVSLVIYKGVYLAEIIRGGIESLPPGQTQAATALGLGYWDRNFRVILPQALYNMLPSMLSQFISTVKDTSIGYIISAPELTFAANQVNASLMTKPFEVFALLAFIYFMLNLILSSIVRAIERRLGKSKRNEQPVSPADATQAT